LSDCRWPYSPGNRVLAGAMNSARVAKNRKLNHETDETVPTKSETLRVATGAVGVRFEHGERNQSVSDRSAIERQ
jgi:hypothetical protein